MMGKIKLNFNLIRMFVFLSILIGLQSLFLYQYLSNTQSANKMIIHTYEVLFQLNKLSGQIDEVELTHQIDDKDFVKIEQTANLIKKLTIDNPKQQIQCIALSNLIMQTKATHSLKNIDNEIKQRINLMITEENKLLDIRTKSGSKSQHQFSSFIITASIITYIVLIFTVLLLTLYLEKIKKGYQKQKIADEKFRVLFEYSSDIFILFDEQGIIDGNHSALSLLNAEKKSQIIHLPISVILPQNQPDGQSSITKFNKMIEIAKEKGTYSFEFLYKKLLGELGTADVTLTVINLDDKLALLSVWHDITAQKNYRLTLEKLYTISSEKNITFQDKMYQVIELGRFYLKMKHGFISQITPTEEKIIYSIALTNILKQDAIFFPRDTFSVYPVKQNALVAFDNILSTPIIERECFKIFKFESYIGAPIFVDGLRFGVISFADNAPHAIFSEHEATIVQLIAQWIGGELSKNTALNRIRESEERLNRAVRGTSDGLWDWDIKANKIYYSERYEEMLGYQKDELPTTIEAFYAMLHPENANPTRESLENHFKNHVPYNVEMRLKHKNGHYIWFNARGQALWDKKGNAIRMTGFTTDITQRKEVDRLKNEFISTVSHELRTPLTSIRGSVGLLLGGVTKDLDIKTRNLLEIAYSNCERLILLINDILDIDKIESGQIRLVIRPHNLEKLIHQAIELNKSYAEKYKVKLVIIDKIPRVNIMVDGDRFIQALTNLLSNACKFSSEGKNVEISAHYYGDNIKVEVKDYGIGIAKNFRNKIFGKFAQADGSNTKRQGGTGLGLNITKSIIEKFSGQLTFESTEGQGTTFYIELPLQKNSPNEAVMSLTSDHPRILVCEDERDVAYLLKEILVQEGYEVDIAFDAMQATKLLEQFTYCAMTLDLMLPDKSGADLIQVIRENPKNKQMPIVVISATADESKQRLSGNAIGIIDWITKPLAANKLKDVLKQIAKNHKPILLHLEDDLELAALIKAQLSHLADVIDAHTVAQAEDYLKNSPVDLILLDLNLPDGSGLQLMKTLDKLPPKPIIILTASNVSEEISKIVDKVLIKSSTSEQTLIETIKSLINFNKSS